MGVIRSQTDDVFHECPNLLRVSFLHCFRFRLHGTRRASSRLSALLKSTTNLIWALKLCV
jgi:hypothetical protein